MTDPAAQYSVTDLLYLMQRLRDPQTGCPWDIQQNYRSITPSTLEEAYEVVDAIEQDDFDQLRDELGDLLFQVIFYAQLAEEEKRFNFADVVNGITAKLVRRHPHVFPTGNLYGSTAELADNPEAIKLRWEAIKQEERKQKGLTGVLADVPIGLPAFARAQKLQKRAAAAAFDFTGIAEVLSKLREEITEMEEVIATQDSNAIEDEMGDIFFTLINACRHLHVDGEKSLRRANHKFTTRFNHMEAQLKIMGLDWQSQTPDQLDALWRQAKEASN